MERLCDLLFELSNEDRMRILQRLREEASNVTNLSRALGTSNQEISRHVSRLVEAGVAQRDADGLYRLTPFGELILTQMRGLEFSTRHREYFRTHLLADLPPAFLLRLGELERSEFVDDVMVALYNVERVIEEAEEYVWRLTDRYDMMALSKLEEATGRGVEFRLMQSRGFEFPPDWPGEGIILSEARLEGVFKLKISDLANVFIAMSEKEVAALAFPKLDGRFDYLGFASRDGRAHRWCHELYRYYWDRAQLHPLFKQEER